MARRMRLPSWPVWNPQSSQGPIWPHALGGAFVIVAGFKQCFQNVHHIFVGGDVLKQFSLIPNHWSANLCAQQAHGHIRFGSFRFKFDVNVPNSGSGS